MKPPFRYYGGKTRIAPAIVECLPGHEHYVEPFAGGLSVLFAKEASRSETVNDLHRDLMTFWRVLRDRPEELERVCMLTPHARAEHASAYEASDQCDDLERARKVWTLLAQSRGASTVRTGWRYAVDPRVASLARTLKNYAGRFTDIASRLANVSLECRPALDVVADYGRHPDVCLYVDPPYLHSTRNVGAGCYAHEMSSDRDHAELLSLLKKCRASVVLSGYQSPLYDDLLDGWEKRKISATTSRGATFDPDREEVLWINRTKRKRPTSSAR